MLIRAMTQSDWSEVSRIYAMSIETGHATFNTVCPDWETWDRIHHKVCRLVAVDGDTVVGWVALTPVSPRPVFNGVAEVSIYVNLDRRRQGIGRLLLESLIKESEAQGFWTLQSTVFSDNIASRRLHEACGFRMVGYRERLSRNRFGEWQDTYLMERRSSL